MALSDKHLKNYCYGDYDSGREACRYMVHRLTTDGYVVVCAKHSKNQQEKIRAGKGDNCKGYPYMLYVLQGYDLDGK